MQRELEAKRVADAENARLQRELEAKRAADAENARLQRESEAKRAADAENARLQRFEISGWVREFTMNRYTEDEINKVIDIFVVECGVYTLSEVFENSAEFSKDFFKEHRVKLGFATAIVKAISSLGGISVASSNMNFTEPLPAAPPVVHNKIPNKDSDNNHYDHLSASKDNKDGNADYIEVSKRGAVISSGQSEVLDCDYFHNVS